MNSALAQPRPAAKNVGTKAEPKLEFIKIDDGHILARVTRGDTVAEAIISTVPPGNHDDEEALPNVAAVSQDAP
jgi:hypothetical protein